MKKFYYLITLALLIKGPASIAQNLVAVHHNNTATFFTTLNSALTGASDGDTIYIPGGTYIGIAITKRLHLIGVGHHPDSTYSTARTHLSQINLDPGCSGGSLTGLAIDLVSFQSDLNNFLLNRCFISSIIFPAGSISKWICTENIFGSLTINRNNFYNFYFANNIFQGPVISNMNNAIFRNNIFLSSEVSNFWNARLENNFFFLNNANGSYCLFYNNVNAGCNGINCGSNQGSGNFTIQGSIASLFINYNPNIMTGSNIYQANFHLIPGSPYANAGRDGTEIGIYGGAYPWKDGSIPFNPHVQNINISPVTNSSGNLDVNIQVEAQDR